MLVTRTCATLSPNPPKRLCSSAVTTQPVFFVEFKIIFSSSGLTVAIFITSAPIPIELSFSEAFRASQTRWPVAIIVTSLPSVKRSPLPIIKGALVGVKLGTFGRPNLK